MVEYQCYKCNHKWNYQSDGTQRITCPSCYSKLDPNGKRSLIPEPVDKECTDIQEERIPWNEFDLRDLKKLKKEGKDIKTIAHYLRRDTGETAIKLVELGIYEDRSIVEPKYLPDTISNVVVGPDNIVDDLSNLRVENKNLLTMNRQLEKEIKENEQTHRKKVQELSDHKTKLDPTKDFIRCPHCRGLWEIQKVIEE